MNAQGWSKYIMQASENADRLNLLADLLAEMDESKQHLRDKGYGWTGLSLLETGRLVPENNQS